MALSIEALSSSLMHQYSPFLSCCRLFQLLTCVLPTSLTCTSPPCRCLTLAHGLFHFCSFLFHALLYLSCFGPFASILLLSCASPCAFLLKHFLLHNHTSCFSPLSCILSPSPCCAFSLMHALSLPCVCFLPCSLAHPPSLTHFSPSLTHFSPAQMRFHLLSCASLPLFMPVSLSFVLFP